MKLNYKIFLCAILATTVAETASASQPIDIYAGAMIGAGGATMYFDDNHKNNAAQSFGAVFGISTNDAMLNAYFKMLSTVVHPYIGVGVGSVFSGNIDIQDTKYDIKTSVAYQGMLGLTFDISALPINFDIEGRVLYAPNFAEFAGEKPDMLHYDARLKLRYVF